VPPDIRLGVLAGIASSLLGGTAIVATRFLAPAVEPLTLGALRFGIGTLCLAPILIRHRQLIGARDLPAIAALGLLFFALFPFLLNAALVHTTAARGSLALSTLPLLTLALATLLGAERLTALKAGGIALAIAGVALALNPELAAAPTDAWSGDLLMVGAAATGALYNVLSRGLLARLPPLVFTAAAMPVGALALAVAAIGAGGIDGLAALDRAGWLAILYLGIVGGAACFVLWAIGLARSSPSLTALTVTVNPLSSAALAALLLGEPITLALAAALLAVAAGLMMASRSR
jgi:drug/metabolite transporter (DMT)-like permease